MVRAQWFTDHASFAKPAYRVPLPEFGVTSAGFTARATQKEVKEKLGKDTVPRQ